VEGMSSSTADALGLSRAILCNDSLVKKLDELHATEMMYEGLVDHAKRVMKATFQLLLVYKAFGDAFAAIGVSVNDYSEIMTGIQSMDIDNELH